MKRREFITLLGGAVVAWPRAGLAQEAGKVRRIGFLRVGEPPAAFIDGFRRGLREVGLVEGRDFVIEFALPQNTAQVPRRDRTGPSPRGHSPGFGNTVGVAGAGRRGPNPGRVRGDLRSGGDRTCREPRPAGRQHHRHDQHQRRCDSETIAAGDRAHPEPARIAILVRETSPTAGQYLRESQAAARSMGISLQIENVRDVNDLDAMFLAVNGVSVLLVADDAEFTARRAELARLGLKHRLPTVSGLKEMVEAGGLMAYGGSFAELYRRAASHVHKILQGTSPADLPVEQPTKFELVMNLKTAKALGLEVPPSLLARADEVIE